MTKNEEIFIKSKANIDITRQKNLDNTILRKPTQDRGYLIFIPQNEETPAKSHLKNKHLDISIKK